MGTLYHSTVVEYRGRGGWGSFPPLKYILFFRPLLKKLDKSPKVWYNIYRNATRRVFVPQEAGAHGPWGETVWGVSQVVIGGTHNTMGMKRSVFDESP